ncbi:hypothetical protein PSCICN_24970 [Pseudomonas cichorii]|uniref:hypothetical protein n=1 Tax=Pseudomonas cichorii TaxID=36746 RepID=UPI0019107642|nr:hypothetical protein [Pseudomonas cichorii]GFM81805.1 hypothetical protein PSCICN_24970 [Pseudomonas cichorii]
MIGNRIAALGLATLLAGMSAGAWAGSTGPTHPDGNDPDSPAMELKSDQEDNTDGSSPETDSRVPDPEQTNEMGSDSSQDSNGDNDSSTANDEKPSDH